MRARYSQEDPAAAGPEDTIAAKRTLIGAGVHTGAVARLDLHLAPPRSAFPGARRNGTVFAPVFSFPGFPERLTIADLLSLPRHAARSTILGTAAPGNFPATIRTPEHFLAALLFFSDLPLEAICDAAELPCLDGSALPFRDALAQLAPQRASRPAWREYPSDLAWSHQWAHGNLRVRPSDRFRVRYELDRPPIRQAYTLEDPEAAWREVLPARTFAFHSEFQTAAAGGMMAGATIGSGLLLAESESEHAGLLARHREWPGGPFPLLNASAWRMEDELAKHKILDLLGDLALADLALPALDIEIRNGGHQINHLLVDRIMAARG
jgi:UDP-3-O-acyl-N-acetylglucosamine deacetylase